MTLNGHVEVHGDDTVSFEFHAEVTEDYLKESVGGDGRGREYDTERGLCDGLWLNDDVVAGEIAFVPTEREGWRGCRVTGSADRADFGRTSIGRTGMVVVGGRDEYRFVWAPTDSPEAAAQLEHFEFSVTFPGPVTSHSGSGTVWMNTVTWTDPADLVARPGLIATGKREPGLVQRLIWPVGMAVALVAVACIARAVMSRRRRVDIVTPGRSAQSPQVQPDQQPMSAEPHPVDPEIWAPGPADQPASTSAGSTSPTREDQAVTGPGSSSAPATRPPAPKVGAASRPLEPSPWAPPE
jgi:hypothetical protein